MNEREIAELRAENLRLGAALAEARDLLEIAPAFFGFLSLDGVVLSVNKLSAKVIETEPSALIGQFFWECPWWKPLPESAAQIRDAVSACTSGHNASFDIDYWAVLDGVGQKRCVAFNIAKFPDQRLAVSGVDITERKAAEAQVVDVLESMGDSYFSLDKNWKIVRINPHFEEMSRIKRVDQIGRHFLKLYFSMPGAEDTHLWKYFNQAMHEREPVKGVDFYEPFGVWVEVSIYPQADGGLATFVRDVSAQKKNDEALRKAVESRDTFLGIASHELKTPLTSLKLQSQMSRRLLDRQGVGAFSSERITKLIEHSNTQAERLSRLVDDMLDVSRISSGKLSMNFEKVDISKLVTETLYQFEPQLEAAGCVLTTQIDPGVEAKADAYRFEQVVTNLIGNAIKYAPNAPLLVSLKKTWGSVVLRVRDHGPGIPKDKHDRVFERFERVISASKVSGLGLGLHISKEIMEAHRGSITVESETGRGAEFVVTLPS